MKRIKYVLFDLDGTLRYNHPASNDIFHDYAVLQGVRDGPERRKRAARWTHYYWADSSELKKDLKRFPDEDSFWTNYARRHLEALDCVPAQALQLAPEIHAYMRTHHRPEDVVPPEIPQTLQVLQEIGLRLGVLSNRDLPCNDYLCDLQLAGFFDIALVAGELSAWKPDPRIFYQTLDRWGATPEATIYVGDNYYADAVGAERAGITPVLLDIDDIFPDVACTRIRSFSELPGLLSTGPTAG